MDQVVVPSTMMNGSMILPFVVTHAGMMVESVVPAVVLVAIVLAVELMPMPKPNPDIAGRKKHHMSRPIPVLTVWRTSTDSVMDIRAKCTTKTTTKNVASHKLPDQNMLANVLHVVPGLSGHQPKIAAIGK